MKTIWKYLITIAFGLVIALLVLLSKGTFSQTETVAVYKDLCDALFIPGVTIVCFGLLVFASNGGVFNMLKFGMIKLFDLFKRDLTKVKYRTYYDYSEAQKDKNKGFWYLLVVGAVFIVASVVFLVVYNANC